MIWRPIWTGWLDWLAGRAGWAGLSAPWTKITDQVRALIALGAAIAASCEPCVKYHIKKGQAIGLTDAQMREAVAVGRMVKEASARNIDVMFNDPPRFAFLTGKGGVGKTTIAAAVAVERAARGHEAVPEAGRLQDENPVGAARLPSPARRALPAAAE